MNVFRFQTNRGNSSTVGKLVGCVAVALVMLLVWLSADPEAHEHFHHDAGGDEHHCVITDYAAGDGLFLAPPAVVRPVAIVFESIHHATVKPARKSSDYVLLPSCGPPAFGLNV